jgi:hypothetical protein
MMNNAREDMAVIPTIAERSFEGTSIRPTAVISGKTIKAIRIYPSDSVITHPCSIHILNSYALANTITPSTKMPAAIANA